MKNIVKLNIKGVISIFISLIMVISLCAITSSAATLKLSKKSVTMVKGVSYTLKVSGTSDSITWSSSDKSVATVTKKGRVKAVAAGSAVISAKVGSTTLKCKVKVIEGTVKTENASVSVAQGEKTTISFTVKGDKSVGIINSNSKVAQVTKGVWNDNILTCNVSGLKAGTTRVTLYLVKDKSIRTTVRITVSGTTSNVVVEAETDDSNNENSSVENMSYAEQILYYVNIERENEGLKPLVLDDKLCAAAEIRAAEIVNSFSHIRPNGTECFTALDDVGYRYYYVAENIAAGNSTAKATVNQWMNSTGHRANILGDCTELGAAMVYDKNSSYGYYWVQCFGLPQ